MKANLHFIWVALICCCLPYGTRAQSYEGTSFTFGYNAGRGNWANFNNVLNEYRSRYPYFTDNDDLSQKKQGFIFGFNIVENKKRFIDASIGGIKSTAWSCGHAPTGNDVCETYLVKSEYMNLEAGRYLFNKPGIRLGFGVGLSLNFVRVKSSSASQPNKRAKEYKYLVMIGGSEINNLQSSVFAGAHFTVPFAFGKKYAFGVAPFFTLPFWMVNTKTMRRMMMPNSNPLLLAGDYKGWMSYWGLRFTFSIGGVSL